MTTHPASASRAGVVVGVLASLVLHGLGGGALTAMSVWLPPPVAEAPTVDVALLDAAPAPTALDEAEDAADADPEPKPTPKPKPEAPPEPSSPEAPEPDAPEVAPEANEQPPEAAPEVIADGPPTPDDAIAADADTTADAGGVDRPTRKPKTGTVPRRPKPAPRPLPTDDGVDPSAVKEVVNKDAVRNTTVDCDLPEPDIRVDPEDPHHWIVRKALIERYATSMKEFNSLGWSRPSPFEEAPGRQIGGFGCTSPLYKAGMRARDVIQTINDKRMYTVAQVIGFWLFGKKKGDFTFGLYRRGQTITHTYTVLEDEAFAALPPLPPPSEPGSDPQSTEPSGPP